MVYWGTQGADTVETVYNYVHIYITTNNIPSTICSVSQFRAHCLALKCPELYGNLEDNNA